MPVSITEDPARPGRGLAQVVLPGCGGQRVTGVTFTREGYGTDSLGPRGWQVAAARLAPLEVTTEGTDLVLTLGPEAALHLDAGPVRFGVPELGLDEVVIWPDIPPPPAEARPFFGAAPRREELEPQHRPDLLEPVRAEPVKPEPPRRESLVSEGDPPPPRASRWRLALLAAAGTAVLGGGAWFAMSLGKRVDPGHRPASSTSDPTDRARPDEIAAMNLPPVRVMEIAQRRQATGRHDDALLLFELASDRGHAPALGALARLYDPATFTPGGALSAPNALKAAEYWKRAERGGDPGAAASRAALRQRLEAAARNGDALAAIALKDHWP